MLQPDTKPLISVVLCTYNNADSLRITLQQLNQQEIDNPADIELVLINNNSTDHTADVAASLHGGKFSYQNLFENQQGLSHARNLGVTQAQGDYILFTDDDADLPPDWLANYLRVLRNHNPECAYSKIAVIWDKPQPWWYRPEYRPFFVELNYGERELVVTDIHHEFFGKNFCVKRQFIIDAGGFDPALGRMGDKLVAGEETLLYRKLVANQCKLVYFPEAGVGHRLKAKEYTEAHIHKLCIDGAYTSVQIARVCARQYLFGRPAGLLVQVLKTLPNAAIQFCAAILVGDKSAALYHKLRTLKTLKIFQLWIEYRP